MTPRSGCAQCGEEDVDAEGVADLVCHFENNLDAVPGDSTVDLDGETFDGMPIHGGDVIRIVPDQ